MEDAAVEASLVMLSLPSEKSRTAATAHAPSFLNLLSSCVICVPLRIRYLTRRAYYHALDPLGRYRGPKVCRAR